MALPKKNRLRNKKDIDRVFKKGMTVRGIFLFVKFLGNQKEYSRFAFIVPSKHVRLAVDRNRARRVLSEFVRSRYNLTGKDVDVIVAIYKKLDRGNMNDLIDDLKNILREIS